MWSDVINGIKGALDAAFVPGVVELGGSAETPRETKVWIIRGPGSQAGIRQGRAEGTLYIECWVYDQGNPLTEEPEDIEDAYAALDLLEETVLVTLLEWAPTADLGAIQLKLTFGAWESDGGAFRPAHGSRLTIEFAAQRRRTAGACV